jgi:hypothetical protein
MGCSMRGLGGHRLAHAMPPSTQPPAASPVCAAWSDPTSGPGPALDILCSAAPAPGHLPTHAPPSVFTAIHVVVHVGQAQIQYSGAQKPPSLQDQHQQVLAYLVGTLHAGLRDVTHSCQVHGEPGTPGLAVHMDCKASARGMQLQQQLLAAPTMMISLQGGGAASVPITYRMAPSPSLDALTLVFCMRDVYVRRQAVIGFTSTILSTCGYTVRSADPARPAPRRSTDPTEVTLMWEHMGAVPGWISAAGLAGSMQHGNGYTVVALVVPPSQDPGMRLLPDMWLSHQGRCVVDTRIQAPLPLPPPTPLPSLRAPQPVLQPMAAPSGVTGMPSQVQGVSSASHHQPPPAPLPPAVAQAAEPPSVVSAAPVLAAPGRAPPLTPAAAPASPPPPSLISAAQPAQPAPDASSVPVHLPAPPPPPPAPAPVSTPSAGSVSQPVAQLPANQQPGRPDVDMAAHPSRTHTTQVTASSVGDALLCPAEHVVPLSDSVPAAAAARLLHAATMHSRAAVHPLDTSGARGSRVQHSEAQQAGARLHERVAHGGVDKHTVGTGCGSSLAAGIIRSPGHSLSMCDDTQPAGTAQARPFGLVADSAMADVSGVPGPPPAHSPASMQADGPGPPPQQLSSAPSPCLLRPQWTSGAASVMYGRLCEEFEDQAQVLGGAFTTGLIIQAMSCAANQIPGGWQKAVLPTLGADGDGVTINRSLMQAASQSATKIFAHPPPRLSFTTHTFIQQNAPTLHLPVQFDAQLAPSRSLGSTLPKRSPTGPPGTPRHDDKRGCSPPARRSTRLSAPTPSPTPPPSASASAKGTPAGKAAGRGRKQQQESTCAPGLPHRAPPDIPRSPGSRTPHARSGPEGLGPQ